LGLCFTSPRTGGKCGGEGFFEIGGDRRLELSKRERNREDYLVPPEKLLKREVFAGGCFIPTRAEKID